MMAFRRRLEEGSGCLLLIWGLWDIVQCTKTVDSNSDTCQEILIDIWGVIVGNWLVPRGSNRLWQTRIVTISYYGYMVQLRYGTSLRHDKYIYMHIIVSVSKKADDVKISMRRSQSLSINCFDSVSLWALKRQLWLLAFIFCDHWVTVKGCPPLQISIMQCSNSEWLRSAQKFRGAVAAQVLWRGNHDLRLVWFGIPKNIQWKVERH